MKSDSTQTISSKVFYELATGLPINSDPLASQTAKFTALLVERLVKKGLINESDVDAILEQLTGERD